MKYALVGSLVLFLASACWGADLDVFLVAGQSNAQGFGTAAQSPKTFPDVCLSWTGSHITTANDPVGGASSGSAWPQFTRSYYSATGRAVMVVPEAASGTPQVALAGASDSNWDLTGTLFTQALVQLTAALEACPSAGWTPHYKGVIWLQGETDAVSMATGQESVARYKQALFNLINRHWNYFPGSSFFIIRIGDPAGSQYASASAQFAAVRQAQEEVAFFWHESRNVRIAYRGTSCYPTHGLQQPGLLHYTQQGYNLMGRYVAASVLSDGLLSDNLLIEGVYPNVVRTEFQVH